MSVQRWLERRWYGEATPPAWLRALSRLFGWLADRRRRAYRSGARSVFRAGVPVIVVGNISVGGVGKTPLVIAVCQALKERGYRPGVVSRGYGRTSRGLQRAVPQVDAATLGDEPLLIYQATGCPVVVAERRDEAVRSLLQGDHVDVVLSDDGLQHYALGRDIEIAVVDGSRGVGNGWLLPAGPLREPVERLEECDLIVSNGEYRGARPLGIDAEVSLQPQRLKAIGGGAMSSNDHDLGWLRGKSVHAVAGIGHPARFFASLSGLGARPIEHPFPDHHRYRASELNWPDDLPLVMTEKDAVKCAPLLNREAYVLEVGMSLEEGLMDRLVNMLDACGKESQT